MKCPNCAMEEGKHDQGCWEEQVKALYKICVHMTQVARSSVPKSLVLETLNVMHMICKRNDMEEKS